MLLDFVPISFTKPDVRKLYGYEIASQLNYKSYYVRRSN